MRVHGGHRRLIYTRSGGQCVHHVRKRRLRGWSAYTYGTGRVELVESRIRTRIFGPKHWVGREQRASARGSFRAIRIEFRAGLPKPCKVNPVPVRDPPRIHVAPMTHRAASRQPPQPRHALGNPRAAAKPVLPRAPDTSSRGLRSRPHIALTIPLSETRRPPRCTAPSYNMLPTMPPRLPQHVTIPNARCSACRSLLLRLMATSVCELALAPTLTLTRCANSEGLPRLQ